jgi:hypothetical protein
MRNLTVSTRVRPGRVAVLVDIDDAQWQSTCLRVIEYFTRLWGGCGNIIIPTDGKTIRPLFWRILELFDPDYLDAYARTGRDVELEEPSKFEDAYQRHIAGWEQQIGDKTEPHAAATIRDNLRHSGLTHFGISLELQQELRDRLAPLYFQQWIVEAGSLGASSVPHHPHTDVIDILPHAEHAARVMRLPETVPFSPLWWAASFGSVNDELQVQLAKLNTEVFDPCDSPDDLKLMIRLAVKTYEEIESAAFFANTTLNKIHDVLQSVPFRISMAGLDRYRSVRHPDWMELPVAVAGTSIEDFCLYYALSRMQPRVVWIPPSIIEEALGPPPQNQKIDAAWHFINDLASLSRGTAQRHGGLKIVSVSLTDLQLEQIRTRLSQRAVSANHEWQISHPREVIPQELLRLYEAKNITVLRSITVQNDGTIPLFETPIPKTFATVDPSKHRWLTELTFSQYRLPRHYVLGERLMGSASFTSKDVRISSSGPTYFCPSWFILGGASAESSVPRPSIRVPEPMEIFTFVARAARLTCTTSDKGFYAENACQKFGGLASLAQFLRSQVGQLFAAVFLDKGKPEDADHLKGVPLAGRRYLDLNSLATTIGNEEEAADLLDRLASTACVYRGFVLQCEYCRRVDWFPLAELTDAFTCKRCHRTQVFTSKHWRHPSQPYLYYQLDELVYLGLEHNMQVPLLALDALQRMSTDSFLYVHELGYREQDAEAPHMEVDVNCVTDGLLTIGEAKKDNRLGKNDKEESETISKYLDLAKRLAAHQVVFATASEQWHPSTAERIKNAFKSERFQLILFSRKHLYGGQTTA